MKNLFSAIIVFWIGLGMSNNVLASFIPSPENSKIKEYFPLMQSGNSNHKPFQLIDDQKDLESTNAKSVTDYGKARPVLPMDRSNSYMSLHWQRLDLGSKAGSKGLAINDINNDGKDEIVLISQDRVLYIMSYEGDEMTPLFWKEFNSLLVGFTIWDIDGDGFSEVYALTNLGTLYSINGSDLSMSLVHEFPISNVDCFRISDIQGDFSRRIIFSKTTYYGVDQTEIYDWNSFELIWQSTTIGSSDIETDDFNGDGFDEIVFSEGLILDGNTFETYWQYNQSFGNSVFLYDLDNDGIAEIVSETYNSIIAYSGVLKTPLWEFTTTGYNDWVLPCDYNGDGVHEILCGGNQWDDLFCYDAQSHQLLWTIDNPDSGISQLALGDPDTDGVANLLWATSANSMGGNALVMYELDDFQLQWNATDIDPPFHVQLANVTGDNSKEIILASRSSASGYDGGTVQVIDSRTNKIINNKVFDDFFDDIYSIRTADLDTNKYDEILIATEELLYILDGSDLQILDQVGYLGTVQTIDVIDINDDNQNEIILGSDNGKVYVLNGQTREIIWQSVNIGSAISNLIVDDYLNNGQLKIIFLDAFGIIHVYDATTFNLEWQSVNYSGIRTFTICDLDRNGSKEFIAGTSSGSIQLIDCQSGILVNEQSVASEPILSITTAAIDTSGFERIIFSGSRLFIVNGNNFEIIWQSEEIGTSYAPNYIQNLSFGDIDADQQMDIFTTTNHGIFHFEVNESFADIVPPAVKLTVPPNGASELATNSLIEIRFTEAIDIEPFNFNDIVLYNKDQLILAHNSEYTGNDEYPFLLITPLELLPSNDTIYLTIKASLNDLAGNGLDGNRNGISDGSPADDFTVYFTTGNATDDFPPVFSFLQLSSDEVWQRNPVFIECEIVDTLYAIASPIIYAEMFMDVLGNYGEGIPLKPTDGAFNQAVESAAYAIDSHQLSEGQHTIYVRAKDLAGNWSEAHALSLMVHIETPLNWSMFGGNAQHTFYNPMDTLQFPLQLKWSHQFNNEEILEPLIVNDRVYFATDAGNYMGSHLFSVSLTNGVPLWEKAFPTSRRMTAPSFAYGKLYTQFSQSGTSSSSNVYAFDAINGNELWASPFATQMGVFLSPTISNDKVFVNGGTYGGVYAYAAFKGTELWFQNLSQYDTWTPAVFSEVVYTFTGGFNSALLRATNVNNGNVLWEKTDIPFNWSGYSMGTAPVVDTASMVIYVTSQSFLHAIDMVTKDILWFKEGIFGITPAVDESYLYAIQDGKLKVFHKLTGDFFWGYDGLSSINNPPIISNGHVVLYSDSFVKALRMADFTEAWQFNAGGKVAVGNNHLILGTEDGHMYCFESDLSIGLHNQVEISEMLVYPNPVSDVLLLDLSDKIIGPAKMTITDAFGKTILEKKLFRTAYDTAFDMDVSQLIPGLYYIRITSLGAGATGRFIKL